jgi:hypothetical protein
VDSTFHFFDSAVFPDHSGTRYDAVDTYGVLKDHQLMQLADDGKVLCVILMDGESDDAAAVRVMKHAMGSDNVFVISQIALDVDYQHELNEPNHRFIFDDIMTARDQDPLGFPFFRYFENLTGDMATRGIIADPEASNQYAVNLAVNACEAMGPKYQYLFVTESVSKYFVETRHAALPPLFV